MNILFLDQYSDLGGAQKCLLDLMPAVQEAGWTAHAGVPGNGPLVEALQSSGAIVHAIPCGSYTSRTKSLTDGIRFAKEAPRLARRIRALARQVEADLVYVNGPRVLPAAAWAARGLWPVLFHCHSHVSQRAAAWLMSRAIRRAGATVVACCRYAAEPLSRHAPPSAIRIVYNGVAAPAVARAPRRSNAGLHIGVIGRIAPEKGQAEFLKAARLLTRAFPDCRFVIAGEPLFGDPTALGYRRSLASLAEGVPVEFLGWQDDVHEVLADLDLLVVPSTEEPATTRVILEAYACGVPVIAFATGGIPEILRHGETGFLVKRPTPHALAESLLILLLRQPGRLRAAAEAGLLEWRERFTLDRYQREMLEVMTSAAQGGRRSGGRGAPAKPTPRRKAAHA